MIHDSVFLDQPFRHWLDLFRWSLPHRSYGTTYLGGEGSNVEWLLIYSNACTIKRIWIAFRGIERIILEQTLTKIRQTNSCQLINKYSVPFYNRTYSVVESGCWPFLSRCNWLGQIKDDGAQMYKNKDTLDQGIKAWGKPRSMFSVTTKLNLFSEIRRSNINHYKSLDWLTSISSLSMILLHTKMRVDWRRYGHRWSR